MEKKTYNQTLVCGNCRAKRTDKIPFGMTWHEYLFEYKSGVGAQPSKANKCENCGCNRLRGWP